MHAIQLRILDEGGGWRVTVGDGHSRPVDGGVPAQAVAMVHAALAQLNPPSGRVLVPGRDVAQTRTEDAVGRAIAQALAASGEAWGHLQVLRGRLEGSGETLTLAIDAAGSALAQIPWELAALGEGAVEAVQGGVVVRMGAGGAGKREPRPTVALFSAQNDAPTRRLLTAARGQVAAAGLREVGLHEGPGIVHVMAHGEHASGAVALALEDGPRSASTVSARLGDAVAHAHTVVLSVCHGGAHGAAPLDSIAERLLAGGASVVIAPRRTVAVEAAHRLAAGLYEALGAGGTLARAVAGGRRAVRAWGHPHPSSRWWAWACFTSRLDLLDLCLVPRGWVPVGWPPAAADAAGWLQAAHRDAVLRTDGYVGVEHLLRALAQTDGGTQSTAWLRRASGRMLALWDDVAGALTPHGPAPHDPVLTPRLAAFGPRLGPAFDMDALAALLIHGPLLPDNPPPPADAETLFTGDSAGGGHPAHALQVLGGPEDGRILHPEVGDAIGRFGGDARHTLYASSRLTDRKLSREHCIWEAPSRVHLRRAGTLQRGSGRHRLEGPVDLRSGDILMLSAGTRLLAVAENPDDGA